jgi:hypothetical protein
MKLKLVFDSTESAEDAWRIHFEDSGEDWNVYLNARDASIDIERYSQDDEIDLEIPVGVIALVL